MAQSLFRNFPPPVPKIQRSHEHYYHLSNPPPSNNNPNKKFNCDTCNKYFFTRNQYNVHVQSHVECPFPNCNMSADFKIIDTHINNQHLLVNYDSIQIDDETWKDERRKRFPTRQRAELRREQQIERLNRGERISSDSSKRSLKRNSKGNENFHKNRFEPSKKTAGGEDAENIHKIKQRSNKNFERKKSKKVHEPITISPDELYDSDPENKFGIKAFKGTNAFYESTGELSLFSNSKVKPEVSEFFISDEEDNWDSEPSNRIIKKPVVLQNALGSLMGNYNSDSEDEDPPQLVQNSDISLPIPEKQKSITRSETLLNTSSKKRKRVHKDKKGLRKDEKMPNSSRKINTKKFRPPTLLERLLRSEIKHERNVILQCVRHVIMNNFFDEPISNEAI